MASLLDQINENASAIINPLASQQDEMTKEMALEAVREPVLEPEPTGYRDRMINLDNVYGSDQLVENRELQWQAEGGVLRGTPAAPVVSFGGAVADSFMHGGNIAVDITKEVYRKVSNGPVDPAFDRTAWIEKNATAIAPSQRWRYYGTFNEAEANNLLADAQADEQAMRLTAAKGGFTAFTAGLISGLIDVDAPLTFFSGGWSTAAKAGIATTKAATLMRGAINGAITGTVLGAADYYVNPNSEAESIGLMAAMGSGFGLAGGTLARTDLAHPVRESTIEELGEQVHFGRDPDPSPPLGEGAPFVQREPVEPVEASPASSTGTTGEAAPAPAAPRAFAIDGEELDMRPPLVESTLGARQANPTYTGLGVAGVDNAEYKATIADAENWRRSTGVVDEWDESAAMANSISEKAALAATRFGRIASRLGVGTDFTRMMRSGNAVFQRLAYNLLESPNGLARRNTNAAVLQEDYRKQMAGVFTPEWRDAAKEYYGKERGFVWTDDWFNPAAKTWRQEFNAEVMRELAARFHGGAGTSSAAAKRAADAIDRVFAKDIEVGVGRNGEIPIEAYKGMKVKPGYFPQKWSGSKMNDMLEEAARKGGAVGREQQYRKLWKFIEAQYGVLHPTMKPADRTIYAKAVVDYATTTRKGVTHDLLGLLRGDEQGIIKDALMRQGKMSEQEVDKVIAALIGSRNEKGTPAHTRERIDIDYRAVDQQSGMRMADLLDDDIEDIVMRRVARTSGLAALARMGIDSRTAWEKQVGAGLAFQAERGKKSTQAKTGNVKDDLLNKADDFIDDDAEITKEYMDGLYSYFSGGPVAGGVGPLVSRIKKLTQLGLLNQLGLTSMAEYGPIAAQAGWQRFWSHLSADTKAQFSKVDSPLMTELKHMSVFVPEEYMFNPRFTFEQEKVASAGELGAKLDKVLNRGVQLQGVLSGFYAVRSSQQRIVLTTATSKLFEGLRTGRDGFSPERLKDMGFEPSMMSKFAHYAQNGTVEFDADGNLVRLNMHRWDSEDVQYFRNAMTRTTNQLVQKAMAGESNVMFHKDGISSLFWQLKSYPLLALEKQFNRNMRMADSQTLQTFFYGLAFAGSVYMARQVINGTTDNLTPEKIAMGAINYSNMAGWIPMWTSPIGALLGLEDQSFNGRSTAVISVPAAFTTLDRMVRAPASFGTVTASSTGLIEYSNNDIRNLQTIPVFGNAYGVNLLLNSMKS